MIYQIFNMFGQAFSAGWNFIVSIVEASGMTKAVFIGLIVTLNVLVIVFGTLRASAFQVVIRLRTFHQRKCLNVM